MYWPTVASISLDLERRPQGLAATARRTLERPSATGGLRTQLAPARLSPWRQRWLALRVLGDAFALDPRGFLQAVAWRARGLRLRSRSRIAALSARSPRAYELWMAREEPKALNAALSSITAASASPVRPVIDCSYGFDGITETLASIGAAGGSAEPILIGGPARSGTIRIENPRELAEAVGAAEAWLCVMQPGDRLAPGALALYSDAAARAESAWIVYGDDDLVASDGRRQAPHFKPDWNPELFEHHDFVSGSAIVRTTRAILSQLPSDGWAEALLGTALGRGAAPLHLPLVLHNRLERPAPIVPERTVKPLPLPAPSVTVVIPTRNEVGMLRDCVAGLRRTSYPHLELIVIDNGSDEPQALAFLRELEQTGVMVLRMPGAFNFSALNNAAVAHAQGEYLCFLNNDVEMIDPDWLSLLVRQAARPELGAVGARLLYPDGTVQHAGVFTGIGGGAGHGHRYQREDEPGYFERARLPQRVSAVTAACLVVAREKFLEVGGFDEQDFPVAFNDVDLCLKLNQRGWQSFYEPRAALIHHESKSRGSDSAKPNRARFAAELAALKRKWHTDRRRDPYHHPQLSPLCEQFLIAI